MNSFTYGFALGTAMCAAGLMGASFSHARIAVQNVQPDVVKTTAGFTLLGAVFFVVAGVLMWPATKLAVVFTLIVAVAAILRARQDYTLVLSYAADYPTARRRR